MVLKESDGKPTSFETRDLPLITLLSKLGYKKTYKLVRDVVYAEFESSPELADTVTKFYGHKIKIDPIEFAQDLNFIRQEIFKVKGWR